MRQTSRLSWLTMRKKMVMVERKTSKMMKNENFRWILQTMANSASMMSFKSKGCLKPKVLCSESSLLVSFDFCCKDQLYQL
ncbi:hypothetical protein U0070_010353 [Myodes glareolus]|uniref:Uncharacterized protein n=1 Tax=Myodes glareolus TaxID=447135 RepID=A0AAW0I7E6_MYOGA